MLSFSFIQFCLDVNDVKSDTQYFNCDLAHSNKGLTLNIMMPILKLHPLKKNQVDIQESSKQRNLVGKPTKSQITLSLGFLTVD